MKIDLGIWDSIFCVPTTIIDKHLTKCGAVQLKVLLYLLRFPGMDITVDEISEKLLISKADVSDSLNYWICENIISDYNQSNQDTSPTTFSKNNLRYEKENIKNMLSGKNDLIATLNNESNTNQESNNSQSVKEKLKLISAEDFDKDGFQPMTIAPRLGLKEALERIAKNEELKFLMEQAPKILGRHITSTDTIIIISFIDWTGISIDLVLMLIDYCASINKRSAKMIEKEAYRWINNGIETHEKAEEYIKGNLKVRKMYDDVMFALHKNYLTERDKSFVKKWVIDYEYDINMIKLAYERALMRKGEKDLSYVNGILSSWHKKGIVNPKQVENENNHKIKSSYNKSNKKSPGMFQSEEIISFSIEDLKAKIDS